MFRRSALRSLPLLLTLVCVGCDDNRAELDGSILDGSVLDAGARMDAGTVDSGAPSDAGDTSDAGGDAGPSDSGPDDAGVLDAGPLDAGPLDAGPADAGPLDAGACEELQNTAFAPVDTCLHGAADWLAWPWIPSRDLTITRVELHSDDGEVALLADDGGRPGATLLSGTLESGGGVRWRGFEPSTPVEVTGGVAYWMAENVGTCSVAGGGTSYDYFTSNSLSGPWGGPFSERPHTSRVFGTCR